jgi:drug/metabolite transporter (DMT)-like permease
MNLLGLGCVLLAALLHATWNFLAKRVQGDVAFTWVCDLCGMLLWAPAVAIFVISSKPMLSPQAVGVIGVSSVLQIAYLWSLQRGYRVGDFSLVYPIARGTGAGGAVLGAVLLLGERITLLGGLGAAGLLLGILIISSGRQHVHAPHARQSIGYGLTTGLCIAAYTLWDKTAVTTVGLAPILLYYGVLWGRAALLAPIALQRWPMVQRHWQQHRREAIGITLLMCVSYVLVLTALTFTPASAVAPAREVSILFGVLIGHRLLAEGHAPRRLFAASLIVLGIIAIVLGGTLE